MEQKKPTNGLVLFKSTIESDKVQKRIEQCVKENKGAFTSSLLDLYSGDSSLQKCDTNLLVGECLKAAALNLPINKALGFAYIVVYNTNKKVINPQTGRDEWVKIPTPTFIPGYKGYIQLAMRTGMYKTINADVVYEGELVKKNKLSGGIDLSGDKKSEKIVGYFAYFELVNGFSKTLFMSVEDMAAYALRYAPSLPKGTTKEQLIAKANDGIIGKQVGWMGNYNDMAIKTCIRRLISKYGYMSIEMQGVVSREIETDTAMSQRQEIIGTTETKTIDMDAEEAEIIEIDNETGEVKETTAPTLAPESEEAPY